jgi:hypothetical protein
MTYKLKRKINSSVVEFVNRELHQCAAVGDQNLPVAAIVEAYVQKHAGLIRESGITSDQLCRMIEYTIEIGYPQDAFLCSEFGPVIEESAARLMEAEFDSAVLAPNDPILKLRPADFERMAEAIELRIEERGAVRDRLQRINELLRPFRRGDTPEPNTEDCIRMLAAKYDDAVANHAPREQWMQDFQLLVMPVRLIEPELSTFEAFLRVCPKCLAVEISAED